MSRDYSEQFSGKHHRRCLTVIMIFDKYGAWKLINEVILTIFLIFSWKGI